MSAPYVVESGCNGEPGAGVGTVVRCGVLQYRWR